VDVYFLDGQTSFKRPSSHGRNNIYFNIHVFILSTYKKIHVNIHALLFVLTMSCKMSHVKSRSYGLTHISFHVLIKVARYEDYAGVISDTAVNMDSFDLILEANYGIPYHYCINDILQLTVKPVFKSGMLLLLLSSSIEYCCVPLSDCHFRCHSTEKKKTMADYQEEIAALKTAQVLVNVLNRST
jgi:hypothetical protein